MIDAPAPEFTVEQAFERYRAPIFAFFSRRLRNVADAEDATQEVFASLSRRAEIDSIADIERYIFQAAANHLRDRHRRTSARPPIAYEAGTDTEDRLVDGLTPEHDLIAREAHAIMIAALQELPERPRMIFLLNRYEEMTGREIAAMLGVSQRLVEKDISRVLTLLRERLS
jgi:RNA polymerase sigma-70 factor (ECF subfamily)